LCPFTSYGVIVNGESQSIDATPGTVCHDSILIYVNDTGEVTASFDTLNLEQHHITPYSVQFINTTIGGRLYSWRIYDENGTLIYTSTLESPLYTFAYEGCYQIVLIAESKWGCKDTMVFNPLCVGTGIDETSFQNHFTIFPNPAIDYINIKTDIFSEEIISIQFFDESGKVLSILPAQKSKGIYNLNKLQLEQIPDGFVYIKIITQSNVITKKLIIIHK